MCILEVVLAIIEQYNLLVRSVNRAKATYRQLYIPIITFSLYFVCFRRRLTKINQLKFSTDIANYPSNKEHINISAISCNQNKWPNLKRFKTVDGKGIATSMAIK